MAAILSVGGRRALGNRSAAALLNLRPVVRAPIEVLVAGGSRRRRSDIVIQRSTSLMPQDLTVRHGIPVTTVARTLVDLGGTLNARELREAFYRAQSMRAVDRVALLRCLRAAESRRGTGTLRELLSESPLPLADANAGLERRFIRFCGARGLPIPEVNAPLGDYTVDCLSRPQRLVVELDSWEFHRDRESFEADRRRDAWLQTSGHRIVRVTHRRLKGSGVELEAELRVLLGLDAG
jgi:hypothetical protein